MTPAEAYALTALLHPRVALFHGEALALMRALIKDKSIDLVCTDPPYGAHTHKNLGKERRGDGRKQRPELTFPPLTHEQVTTLAAEFVRVCKGWIVVFTDDRSVDWWGRGFELAGGSWIRTGHWIKTNPMPLMRGDRPGTGTEPIVIGHADPLDLDTGEESIIIAHAIGRNMKWFSKPGGGGGRPALWRGPRDFDDLHPNQKPLWLMQELLGLFAPAGSVVLDPFIGSGSTIVAGLATTRFPGLVPLETACKGCQKKHAEHVITRPVLPDRFEFVGIEGHAPTLQVAKTRLEHALQGVAA